MFTDFLIDEGDPTRPIDEGLLYAASHLSSSNLEK